MKAMFLTLLLTVPALAIAQTAEPAQDVANQDVASPDVAKHGSESRAERDARRDCMRYTGSRITASRADRKARADAAADADVDEAVNELDRDDCIAANGRVYSREDLRRTGEVDIADALRKLDPAIR